MIDKYYLFLSESPVLPCLDFLYISLTPFMSHFKQGDKPIEPEILHFCDKQKRPQGCKLLC